MVSTSRSDSPADDAPQAPAPTSTWQKRTAQMRAVGQKIEKTSMGSTERLALLRRQAELADAREASLSRRLPRDL